MCLFLCREIPLVVKQKTREATRCLQLWKQSYLDVRKKIETSGRDARWEFDRKRLFDRSDYMAQICEDIYGIVQVCAYIVSIMYTYLRICILCMCVRSVVLCTYVCIFILLFRLLRSSTIYLALSSKL